MGKTGFKIFERSTLNIGNCFFLVLGK